MPRTELRNPSLSHSRRSGREGGVGGSGGGGEESEGHYGQGDEDVFHHIWLSR